MKILSIRRSEGGDSLLIEVLGDAGITQEYLLTSRPSMPDEAVVSLVQEMKGYMDEVKRLKEENNNLRRSHGELSGSDDTDTSMDRDSKG